MITGGVSGLGGPLDDCRKRRCKPGVSSNPAGTVGFFYSHAHRGWSRSREIFGACGRAAGGGYPPVWCGVRGPCGPAGGLDGGGLPV